MKNYDGTKLDTFIVDDLEALRLRYGNECLLKMWKETKEGFSDKHGKTLIIGTVGDLDNKENPFYSA